MVKWRVTAIRERTESPRLARAIVLALLSAILAWQVVTRSFVAHLAAVSPEAALRLRPGEPVALLNLAEQVLSAPRPGEAGRSGEDDPAGVPGNPERYAQSAAGQIRDWAEGALRSDPLNARALRILGRFAVEGGNEQRATALMAAAARRSLNESRAISWLLGQALRRGDHASATRWADVLLRTQPQLMPALVPILARMAEHREASPEIRKLLAEKPPWRAGFLVMLPQNAEDPRRLLDFFISLRDGPAPLAAEELRGYLNFLVQKGSYDLAYYAWLQFLPRERLDAAGLLFNGDFASTPSGAPFDWMIAPGAGVTIDIKAHPEQEGQRALFTEFGYGRVEFPPVTQMIMLSPGFYRLRGSYKGEIVGRRGLQWSVTCAGGKPAVLGQSPMVIGAARDWTAFEVGFTVPPTDCGAQYVSLALAARSASEQLVSGSIWYGALRIEHGEGK